MSTMHDVFMKTAFLIAEKSHCVSHHVGTVIVKDSRIISMGYNGTPPKMGNCSDYFDKDNFDRAEHHAWSKDREVHSELNALMFAVKNGLSVKGASLYVTISPCNDCLKNIIMAGIKNIYYLYLYDLTEINKDLAKLINIQEVPGAEDIKQFIEKNNLLYKCSCH